MRAKSLCLCATVSVAAFAALSSPALANEAAALDARVDRALADARPGQFVRVDPLGPTRRAPDGLLEVRLAGGEIVRTHGLDPEAVAAGSSPTPADAAASASAPQRGLSCAGLPRLRVFYVHPSDRPSRWSRAMYQRIRGYMRQMSYRLYADALASSQGRIGADYRIGCLPSGLMNISPLRTRTTAARDDWSVIQEDMKRAGLDSPESKYLIWYDDPVEHGCGIANLWKDERKSDQNANNRGPRYALVYGNTGTRACWGWRIGMHENAHNMGAVQYRAPRSSGDRWHCNDGLDVMCYADGGDKSDYTETRCGSHIFDCGGDTYFDTLTEQGEWLRSHWNIGWSGNRFLEFPHSAAAASLEPTPGG